ncbi:hypothetical protein CH63R_06436 [Colletotrichum higginsianum IMI 349063]|uniref:Uncharacterized protein n=1 Tax=Colletotrichum higginsianum (strain IMI 349063) TaxID=759273 RepID=A0A1B7YFT9_COLHI|nr:hypothetical protein CH63R_06436 [Colletotrichum higginsianum IMI 349063]OBR10744.1 hypothetical protein CH63R_06436 [Colletotrichum higginsianum IMI 349063]
MSTMSRFDTCENGSPTPGKIHCAPETMEAADTLVSLRNTVLDRAHGCSPPNSTKQPTAEGLYITMSPNSDSNPHPRRHTTASASRMSPEPRNGLQTTKSRLRSRSEKRGEASKGTGQIGQTGETPHQDRATLVDCPCSSTKCKRGVRIAPSTRDVHVRADDIRRNGFKAEEPCVACAKSNRECYRGAYASCDTCLRRKEACLNNWGQSSSGGLRPQKETG